MNRYCGFQLGLRGDLCMATVAARILKRHDPSSHLTFMLGHDYADMAGLFLNNPWIDQLHIAHSPKDAYDREDLKWIAEQQFNVVFNPMAQHPDGDGWWIHRNQGLEAAHMHGLPTAGESPKIQLTKWFKETDGLRDYVALMPFAGFYAPQNDKRLSVAKAQEIVDALRANGHKVLQIGGPGEPRLENAEWRDTDFFGSVRNVLGCKAFIGTDSGIMWALSAYDMPTIGLYGHRYYGRQFVKNIQPENPRARYLDDVTAEQIPLDNVLNSLKILLQ